MTGREHRSHSAISLCGRSRAWCRKTERLSFNERGVLFQADPMSARTTGTVADLPGSAFAVGMSGSGIDWLLNPQALWQSHMVESSSSTVLRSYGTRPSAFQCRYPLFV